jgi:hypothetical protein
VTPVTDQTQNPDPAPDPAPKPTRKGPEPVGETYVVAWPKISLHVPPPPSGKAPTQVTLGTGVKVDIVDEHVTLLKGTPVVAATEQELVDLRLLASVGALVAAPGSAP